MIMYNLVVPLNPYALLHLLSSPEIRTGSFAFTSGVALQLRVKLSWFSVRTFSS